MKKLKVLKNRKGFTLIEIIVVLVIIAILAATTIPAMVGFVNDARGKAYAAEARLGLVAAQAVVTEVIAGGGKVESGKLYVKDSDVELLITGHQTFVNMIGGDMDVSTFTNITLTGNVVSGVVYEPAGTNYVITISGGTTTVTKKGSATVSS